MKEQVKGVGIKEYPVVVALTLLGIGKVVIGKHNHNKIKLELNPLHSKIELIDKYSKIQYSVHCVYLELEFHLFNL